jgi:hypothetical protein
MPTPDASQFTQMKKYSAIGTGNANTLSQQKTITHLHQNVPTASATAVNFLASFTNKFTPVNRFTAINVTTVPQLKPKIPGGNVRGEVTGSAVYVRPPFN